MKSSMTVFLGIGLLPLTTGMNGLIRSYTSPGAVSTWKKLRGFSPCWLAPFSMARIGRAPPRHEALVWPGLPHFQHGLFSRGSWGSLQL